MPSRRSQIELTPREIRDYIDSRKTIIIVSNGKDGFPHPMPMWFHRSPDDRIHCTTFGKSQKVLNYQRDPRATLLVESGTEYAELKSVLIYAQVEISQDYDAVVDCLVHINSRGRALTDDQRANLRESVSATARKRALLSFTPQRYVSWDHGKLGGRY